MFFCLFVFLDIDKYCDGIKCYPGSSVAKPNQPDDRSPIPQPHPYYHGGRQNQIYFAEKSQMKNAKARITLWNDNYLALFFFEVVLTKTMVINVVYPTINNQKPKIMSAMIK